jgi:hypothetical protein
VYVRHITSESRTRDPRQPRSRNTGSAGTYPSRSQRAGVSRVGFAFSHTMQAVWPTRRFGSREPPRFASPDLSSGQLPGTRCTGPLVTIHRDAVHPGRGRAARDPRSLQYGASTCFGTLALGKAVGSAVEAASTGPSDPTGPDLQRHSRACNEFGRPSKPCGSRITLTGVQQ